MRLPLPTLLAVLAISCAATAPGQYPEPTGPWKDLAAPLDAELEAWGRLNYADTVGTAEDWEALRPLLERNRPVLDLLMPAEGAFSVSLPPTLFPETPFPDHQPLRYAVQLQLAASRLAARDGRLDVGLALLERAGTLCDGILQAVDGSLPLINAYATFGDWLDGCLWHLRATDGTPSQAVVRAHVLPLLRSRQDLLRQSLLNGLIGEVELFNRVVDRMPPPGTSMTGYLDAFSVLADPEALGAVRQPDAFGLPRESWFNKELTKETMRAVVGPWIRQLADTDAPPQRDSYTDQVAHITGIWEEQAGALLPYLNDYSLMEPPLPLLPLWMARLNDQENPLGNFLVSMMSGPVEVMTNSLYRREAQRRALILAACGELDEVAPPEATTVSTLERTDPFNGESLRVDPSTHTLWSVGPDETDNEADPETDLVWKLKPASAGAP